MITQTKNPSTGSLALDVKLGTGGWPRGRIVEIYGHEGTGKTTLLLEAIAHAQQEGGYGAFLDADHATDASVAGRLGVDGEGMLFHRPSCLEEAFEKIEELVQAGEVDVIALDSIAALLPDNRRSCTRSNIPPSKDQEHQHQIDHFLKALLGPLSRSRATLLISNQVVEKVGVMFGSPETTPWTTHPLRAYASQRVELRRVMTIKDREEALGVEIKAKVVKNRLAAPFTDATFALHFATGICLEVDLLALGVETGVLTKRGGRISHGEQLLGIGQGDAVRFLRQDMALVRRIREEILDRLRS